MGCRLDDLKFGMKSCRGLYTAHSPQMTLTSIYQLMRDNSLDILGLCASLSSSINLNVPKLLVQYRGLSRQVSRAWVRHRQTLLLTMQNSILHFRIIKLE
jgi:hypothetical protein